MITTLNEYITEHDIKWNKKEDMMNKLRRKEIAKAIELMEEAREILETVRDEEQEAYDNMPESLQNSERGETMEEYISTIEGCMDNLETDALQEIVDG